MPRGTTHFGESEYDREGDAGVATAHRLAEMRIQQQHAQLEAAHLQFQEAERARKTAEAVALANEATARHKRLAASLPLLIGIDPRDDDAQDRYLKFEQDHAEDLENDKAARSQFDAMGKRIAAYRTRAESIQARKDASDAAVQARRDARDAANDIKKQRDDFAKDIVAKGQGKPKTAVIDGVTYEIPAGREITPERRQELHEREMGAIGTKLSAMEKANPTLFNSTGLYTDAKGKQRFGYVDKESDDPNTLATPEQIRQWKAYQDLQEHYNMHDKALSDMRNAELSAASPAAIGGDATAAGNAAPLSTVPPTTDVAPPADAPPPTNPTTGAPSPTEPAAPPTPAAATPPPVAEVTGGPAQVVPAATPHPMEGQTVRHKASGQMGKIINGQFVPD